MAIALPNQRGNDRYHIQVLDRALAILDVLSETTGQFSLAELSTRLPLHKNTLHRLLMVLEQQRFICKHPLHGKYSLGTRLFELGSRAVAPVDVRARAEPSLLGDCSLDLGYSNGKQTVAASRRFARNRVRSA